MKLSYKTISVIFFLVIFIVIFVLPSLVLAVLQPFEVSDIAKKITVSIEGFDSGSGVIIDKNKNDDIYQVMTAWHVIEKKGKYQVRTYDNRIYPVNNGTIKQMLGVDLAVVEFTSKQTYPIAQRGTSNNLKEGMTVFIAGYSTPGPVDTGRNYKFLVARITTILINRLRKGYSLVYDNFAISGMSGGPVLNENGELVGIHGETEIRELTGASSNYAIASETFKNWQQQVALASQRSILLDEEAEAFATVPPISNTSKLNITSTTPVQFMWPAKGVLISGFGMRWGRMHKGFKIANSTGTPIYAAADGVVEKAGWNNGGYGNLIDIRHLDGTLTRYGHNSKILVHAGQQVRQGETIALMGSTGFATEPALQFEIHPNGEEAVNPIIFLPHL